MKLLLNFSRITGLVLLLCASACKKGDFENPKLAEHTADYAFPLFSTDLNVGDLVNNILKEGTEGDTIIVNPNNTLTLFYSGDATETKATNIFKFLIPAIFLPIDTSNVAQIKVQTPDGVALYRADLSSGVLTAIIVNTLPDPINITFYVPDLTFNGQIYSSSYTLQPGQQQIVPQTDLNGWILKTPNNLVSFRYAASYLDGTVIDKLPKLGNTPPVLVALQNLNFYYLEGFWGKKSYGLNTDTIDIEINKTNLDGNVKVKNPRVTITVFNSFGFPTRGLIKYLRFKAKNGDLIELNSPLIQQGTEVGIDFAYPSLAAGEVGQEKATVFYFDETNSNIEELFNSQPTQMIYQVDGLANAENDPTLIGFLTDSSAVRLNVQVELLLEGQLQNFGADQTLDLDFSSFATATLFDEAEFKLVTENEMGLSTNLQVYFQDVNSNTIDSLFANGAQDIIRAATVDPATGIPSGVTRTETFIPMSADRFERLRQNAKKAYLKTAFSTAENGAFPVKILANQGAKIKMGVRVKKKIG